MATIGNPTTGGSNSRKIFQAFKGISITMTENGTAQSITAQIENTTTPGVWQAGIWNPATGVMLDSSATRNDITTNNAYTFTGLTLSLLSGVEYIVGVAADGVADDLGDAVIYGTETFDGRLAGGDADNVDPLANTTWSADSTRDYHILLTYGVGGGSSIAAIAHFYEMLRTV